MSTNWEENFGTPERTAETLLKIGIDEPEVMELFNLRVAAWPEKSKIYKWLKKNV